MIKYTNNNSKKSNEQNCTEYLDNISVLFNIISRDKKTMFDEYVRGIGEFVREDDYDYYDFFY